MYVSDKSKDKLTAKQKSYLEKLKSLDSYYSDKKLGSFIENGKTIFRLFAPSAKNVFLVTFNHPEDETGNEYKMIEDNCGIWETVIEGEQYGLFYGFKVYHLDEDINMEKEICLDPYAKAVATFNTYMNPRKAIVVKENEYDWEGDKWIKRDWRDIIIYEMHVRDMTMHPTSGADKPGSYNGLVEKNKKGGIDYIKNLGVNTVELLPAQEFGNIEIAYKKPMVARKNTWNPYEINHWGYMTAAFFAPEAYYSESTESIERNKWMGVSAKQVNDFKDMVKTFHKEGIAIFMDVVFNHISEYEVGNLKEIDKKYYFRLNADGNFISNSGCGNDIKSERPMMRRMIIDSIIYWMKEYHIDGFRFDLAKIIDWETIEEIIKEAHKINPDVVFIAEPWGGGYDPMGFSLRGWASWNDQYRNGIKGENPDHGQGWIFANWFGNNDLERIKSYIKGTLIRDKHGLFQKKEHAVNYLESHDGYTLGDFIRLAVKENDYTEKIKDINKHIKLTPLQMKLNKLAALFLFVSQGMIMIHEGQEFARSKVIPYNIKVPDKNKGKMDHNSYNKDNTTNYINYDHAEINKELVDYYKGLISLRNTFTAFRMAEYEDVEFFHIKDNLFALGFSIKKNDDYFIVLMNANDMKSEEFILPEGEWNILVNSEKAGINSLGSVYEKILLEPITGVVLKKR